MKQRARQGVSVKKKKNISQTEGIRAKGVDKMGFRIQPARRTEFFLTDE